MIYKFLLTVIFLSSVTACAPRFNTTEDPGPRISEEKTKIQSLYGIWERHVKTDNSQSLMQLTITENSTLVSTNCFNSDLHTSVSSLSRTQVTVGNLTFFDGVTGTIKAGKLDCGIDFPAIAFGATVKDNILTIITKAGPVEFRYKGPNKWTP